MTSSAPIRLTPSTDRMKIAAKTRGVSNEPLCGQNGKAQPLERAIAMVASDA
jgi:hypothetical protein